MAKFICLIITILVFYLIVCPVQSAKPDFSEEKDIALLNLGEMEKRTSFLLSAEKPSVKEIHFNISPDEIEIFKQPTGDYLKVSDIMPYTKPGEPMLPMKTFVVKLPKNSEISAVYAASGKYRKINNKVNIIPTPQAHTFSAKSNIALQGGGNYNPNSYFPGKIVSYITGEDNKNTYVLVRFFPVQYIAGQNEAALITDIKVKIEYKETQQAKNLLLETNYGCVIITPDEFKTEAEKLAEFHNSTNISTTVITTQEIWDNYNASSDPGHEGYKNSSIGGWSNITNYNYTLAKKIISFLNEQSNLNSNLEYVVLFGNGRQVPPSYYVYDIDFENCDCFTCWGIDYYNSWVPTDFFYVSPDYDFIPNYKLGRIPVSDTLEAEHFVNKTKKWYNNLYNKSNTTWFKNFAAVGGRAFVNTECGRYDELFAAELTSVEIINKYLDGMNITKLFLSSSNYNKNNVKDIYSGNYGFIYHFSHGSGDGMWKHHGNWTELVNVSEIDTLSESPRIPVVVSPACMNGAYDTNLYPNDYMGYVQQESYAESLLNSDAGAIGYFGGARTNYGILGLYLKEGYVQTVKKGYMDGMFDGIFKNYHEGRSTLGELSFHALREFVINNEFSDELTIRTLYEYTFLGDPALAIPPMQDVIEPEKPKIDAVNPLYYDYDNIGPGYSLSTGDLPIYSLHENATITCTTGSENVKIKLIDTSEIFNNTNITEFKLSNNSDHINYTFNLTEPHTYLIRCIDENGKEGWLYTKTDVKKAEIIGNYADYVQDTDNDTFYDYLIINVTINVNQDGLYAIRGYLEQGGDYMDTITYISLGEGVHVVSLKFAGHELHKKGWDGNYYMYDLYLFNAYSGETIEEKVGTLLHTTESYNHNQFEPHKDLFIGNYVDYGLDSNNNSLYDRLMINATVNITTPGYYEVSAYLFKWDGNEWYLIDSAANSLFYLNGTQIVQVGFDGYTIYKQGFDGPYSLFKLCISNSNGTVSDCRFTTSVNPTKFYPYTQFEHYPKLFIDFSDFISDSYYETNGVMYNDLTINITVNVSDAGDYFIVGELYDENDILITQSGDVYLLNNGTQTIQLNFSGDKIYDNAVSGNYYLGELYLKNINNTILDYREIAYITNGYNYLQFRMPPELAVTNIYLNSTYLTAGENAAIFALIKNLMTINDKELEEVNVSLYIDNKLNNSLILNLRNIRNYAVNFSWGGVEGAHDVTIKVDADGKISELNESNNELNISLIVYHPCDLNHDGIIIHDWNDLMKSYKCFLGIQNCNKINFQNWNSMKKEYLCFTNITHQIS